MKSLETRGQQELAQTKEVLTKLNEEYAKIISQNEHLKADTQHAAIVWEKKHLTAMKAEADRLSIIHASELDELESRVSDNNERLFIQLLPPPSTRKN